MTPEVGTSQFQLCILSPPPYVVCKTLQPQYMRCWKNAEDCVRATFQDGCAYLLPVYAKEPSLCTLLSRLAYEMDLDARVYGQIKKEMLRHIGGHTNKH